MDGLPRERRAIVPVQWESCIGRITRRHTDTLRSILAFEWARKHTGDRATRGRRLWPSCDERSSTGIATDNTSGPAQLAIGPGSRDRPDQTNVWHIAASASSREAL